MSAPVKGYRVGNYELLAKVGEGGMGSVYRARQLPIDREVALKLLPPELARDREFIERFLREARATAKLNHPNIIAGIDVGQADGYYYFAMEYIHGETLRHRIDREGPLSEREVAHIGAGIASALAHAHTSGLIHRDVKPDNVLLDQEGTPKLADLGLVMGYRDDSTLTKAGNTVGTPHYIAPEQAAGEVKLDGRADMYALGCTLYHAATGCTPFDGPNSAVVMLKHLKDRMPHPQQHVPELSDEFCAVLERMVARDRNGRFEDLNEASELLEMLAEGQVPDLDPLPGSISNFLAPNRRNRHAPARAKLEQSHTSSRRMRPVRLQEHPGQRRASGTLWIAASLVGAGIVIALIFLAGSRSSSLPQENPHKPVAADLPPVPAAAKTEKSAKPVQAKAAIAKSAPPGTPGPPKVIEAPPLPDLAAPPALGLTAPAENPPTGGEPIVQSTINSIDPRLEPNVTHLQREVVEPLFAEMMKRNPKAPPIAGLQINLDADQAGNLTTLRFEVTGFTDLTPLRKLTKLKNLGLAANPDAPNVDLSFLEGTAITMLTLLKVPVESYEPLKATKLEAIIIDPYDSKRLGPVLKAIKTLKTVNGIPAADLLK